MLSANCVQVTDENARVCARDLLESSGHHGEQSSCDHVGMFS